jgi:hypothetical protein
MTPPTRTRRSAATGVQTTGAEPFGSFLGNFNPPEGNGLTPLHQRTIMLIGVQGGGKSTLIESCPYAVIIDADSSGSSNPQRKAIRLPDRTSKVQPGSAFGIDYDGFGYDYVRAICTTLIEKRNSGWEDPCMVGFDLLDSLVDMRRMKLERDRGDKLQNMHGQEAWGVIYDSIRDLIFGLQEARIGVILTTHAIFDERAISDNQSVTEAAPSVPKGIWKRLSRRIDECFYLNSENVVSTTQTPLLDRRGKPRLDADGNALMRDVPGDTKTVYRIHTNKLQAPSESLYMYMKRRVPLDDLLTVEMDDFNSWTNVIEPAYENAFERFCAETE